MTTDTKTPQRSDSFGSWCASNKHFLIAAVILAIAAGGWNITVDLLQWATRKMPVPWPQSVEVDHETFQNISFPTTVGPYKRAEDGQWSMPGPDGKPVLDEVPDGEITIEEDVMEPLGIGSHLDKQRVDKRSSNWYVSRVYLDTRKAPGDLFRAWRFSIYYYTGKHDMVPHIGETCLVAGGATIDDSSPWLFDAPDNMPDGWGPQVTMRRTIFTTDKNTFVQYYVLNSNGRQRNDRLSVRADLSWPTVKHCFFAKIELAPLAPVSDVAVVDKATREFLSHFLRPALATLPTGSDVKQLDADEKQ